MSFKSIRSAITFAILTTIVYVYIFASYYYFHEANVPTDLGLYLAFMFTLVGFVIHMLFIRPMMPDGEDKMQGIGAASAALKSKCARRKRAGVAKKYVKEIYKDELLDSINRGLTTRKFTPSCLNSEIDDIHFVDVADLVIANLKEIGYSIEIDTVDEEYIKDFYCDNVSEKKLKDTQWVNEFKTLHSEWTVSWKLDEVKKHA